MKFLLPTLLLALSTGSAMAQSTDIPLNSPAYDILTRWDIQSEKGFFTTVKPVSRRKIAQFMPDSSTRLSSASQYDWNYLRLETRAYHDSISPSESPIWNTFFTYPSDFFSYADESFDLHVNPVVVFGGGRETNGSDLVFENYRGLEIRGTVDRKVSFYTLLTENQARYPDYVRHLTDSTLGVPYEGFWKQYRETGVDFLRAQAYVDVNISRHIGAQFGYGKHFIGDGRRSLILSDFGNNYPYLRLNTEIWKLQYTNLFAQLVGQTRGGTFGLYGTGGFTKKYLASHHLSMRILPNLTIGLFESVIYGDSSANQMQLAYLNPLMFYRALEQQDGSADNVLLGVDFKWNLWKHISLYGQLVIDELVVSEVVNRTGWWGNKQGFQLGAKYINMFGLEDLHGQMEINRVRPYVYAHENNYTSYSHYNMPLAHPLGANFQEVLFALSYRPLPKLVAQGDLLLAQYGNDPDSLSYGRDILKSYVPANRPGDYGNDLLQGDQRKLTMIHGRVSYLAMHNASLDLDVTFRREEQVSTGQVTNSSIFGLTLRWNFPARSYLF